MSSRWSFHSTRATRLFSPLSPSDTSSAPGPSLAPLPRVSVPAKVSRHLKRKCLRTKQYRAPLPPGSMAPLSFVWPPRINYSRPGRVLKMQRSSCHLARTLSPLQLSHKLPCFLVVSHSFCVTRDRGLTPFQPPRPPPGPRVLRPGSAVCSYRSVIRSASSPVSFSPPQD